MPESTRTGGAQGYEPDASSGAPAHRLAPLPKRVSEGPSESGAAELPEPALKYVDELLERAFVLLSTLTKDVHDVQEDEEELKLKIEAEQARRRTEAAEAKAQVEDALTRAYRIAQNKGKVPVLEQGLLHSKIDVDESADYGEVIDELEFELKAARGITGAIRLGRIGELLSQANSVVKRMQEEADGLRDRQIAYVAKERQSETTEAAASFEIGTMVLERDIGMLEANIPQAARRWDDPGWAAWEPPTAPMDVLRLGAYHHELLDVEIPHLVEFPLTGSLVFETQQGQRDEAIKGVQSMLLRMVAGMPAGAVRFTFVDPQGLGESVSPLLPLGEYDTELIDGAVAKTPAEIEERLTDLTHHMERVIVQYLRGTFESLSECNRDAGEILEPYRVLVVLDHPSQLEDASARHLAAIADNGPRCGVFTIITKDPQPSFTAFQSPLPQSARVLKSGPDGYHVEVANAGQWAVRLDAPPRSSSEGVPQVERIVNTVGQRARDARGSVLELGKLYDLMNRVVAMRQGSPGLPDLESAVDPGDPTTWWSASSADGLATPLGRLGGTGIATFAVDTKRSAMVVAGQPGSGVSNVLDAVVTGLAMLYSPSELQLYLLGLRSPGGSAPAGRALAVYGEQKLPHARLVAVDADRDFALSLLRSLSDEMERRLSLLRETVGERAGYEVYREETSSSEPLPRVLTVIDNLAGLFVREDRTSQRSREVLDQLLRLGPTAGMHLLLVPRSDERALAEPFVSSIRDRLVLSLPEEHALRLLDGAGDAADLARPGDAFLVTGSIEAPVVKQFQTVMVDPTEQAITLRDLHRLMTERGDGNVPQVYDGSAVARLEGRDPLGLIGDGSKQGVRRMPRLWLGEPMGIGPPVEALLRRQDGANLLVVASDPEVGQGLLVSSVVSSLLVHGDHVGVLALDFMPPEAGFSEAAHALESGPWTVQLTRRRSMAKVVDLIHRVVQDRLATDDLRGKPVLFVVNGLGRARDLDANPEGDAHPDDMHLVGTIETILRDGPEVGVHTIAWCDTLSALNRRIPKTALREFALRVAGPMSAQDSLAFVDSESAATLQPNEVLFADEELGKLTKLRPYALPHTDWLEQLGQLATHATG